MSTLGFVTRQIERLKESISPLPLALVVFVLALVWINRDLIPFTSAEFQYQRLLKQEQVVSQRLNDFRPRYLALLKAAEADEAAALLKQLEADINSVEAAFGNFLAEHPAHARAMGVFGNFLEDIGKADEACRWWSRAVAISAKNPDLLNNLANYYGHNGEAARAIRLYEEAIRLNPTEAVYHFNLGNMYYLFRNEAAEVHGWDLDQIFRESLGQFRIARDLEPNNFEYATAYAETFYGVNFLKQRIAWEEALKAWQYCLGMNLDSGQKDYVKVHLVRLNLYTGNPMEAVRSASEIKSQELRRVARGLLNKMFGPPIQSPYSA
jgi:tetratricopeptide (TPR) repeat protein